MNLIMPVMSAPCTDATRRRHRSTPAAAPYPSLVLLFISLLLLLLLQQRHQAAASAGAKCPFNSTINRAPALWSASPGFLLPAARWGMPACSSSSSKRSSRSSITRDCTRRSGSSGVDWHFNNKRNFVGVRSLAPSNSHNSFLQEPQHHDDEIPQIDLARALQLLEAASSGGPAFGAEAAIWGPPGNGAPQNNSSQRSMGEKKRLAVIFNCMLHACERQGDALGGFEVYRQMRATGAPPDEATFHSVAALMERAGEYNGMLKVGFRGQGIGFYGM